MIFKDIYENAPVALANKQVSGVLCDSRRVTKDTVFVCINGSAMDGHKYAQSAHDSGASVIVCERDLGLDNQLVVEDSRIAYATICAAYFGNPAEKLKLIGITGTSGKTSTTFMVKSLLEQAGFKVGLIGTIKNVIGEQSLPAKNTTPDAYELHSLFSLMLKAGCDYVVMEVSSHALDQNRVYGLEFECGVFTNLTQDHLDYHITMDNYLAAKLMLFKMCKKAIVNIDDSYSEKIMAGCNCPVLTMSAKQPADFTAENMCFSAGAVSYTIGYGGKKGNVCVNTPGIFSVYNSLCAGSIGLEIGLEFGKVVEYMSDIKGVKGRVEVIDNNRGFTIIIDYAHTPDELENVITMLNSIKKGRLVTVFGCGGDRDKLKRPVMGDIAAKLSDYVVVTSDNPRSEKPAAIIDDILVGVKKNQTEYTVIENRADAIEYAIENARPDDVILFAGKGHETYQILASGTIHFDEREIIAKALNK